MAKSTKNEPEQPATEMEWLYLQTADSPILVVGTVQNRMKKSGKNEKGDWTIFLVEVRGCEGRCVTVLVNDPEQVPAKGEKVKIPIWVTKTGDLRQAKNVFETF